MTAHPVHENHREVAPGIWDIAFPAHPRGMLGWQVRRRCRKSGGHWWHPADAMIEWKCCVCGASRDGMPAP
jgi:hypothetical protein